MMSLQVRIAVFSQHHVDGLDLSSNPLLYMMRCYPVSSNIYIDSVVCACSQIAILKVSAGSWTLVVVGSGTVILTEMQYNMITL